MDPPDDQSGHQVVVLELEMSGEIRYISPTWTELTGGVPSELVGRPVSSVISGIPGAAGEDVRAVASSLVGLHENDLQFAQFSLKTVEGDAIPVEGQGILVGEAEHRYPLWLLSKQAPADEIDVILPARLAKIVGFGVKVLANFLDGLVTAIKDQAEALPAPPQELCHICDRYVHAWWYERHCEMCMLVSESEEQVLRCHEALQEQRQAVSALLATPPGEPLEYRGELLAVRRTVPAHSFSRFAVRVSSPLASANDPVRDVLLDVLDRCDQGLKVDIPSDTDSSSSEEFTFDLEVTPMKRASSESSADATFTRPPKKQHVQQPVEPITCDVSGLDGVVKDTMDLIAAKSAALTRLESHLQYTKQLSREVEMQVRSAIDSTTAAALEGAKVDVDVGDDVTLADSPAPSSRNISDYLSPFESPGPSPMLSPHLSPQNSPHMSPVVTPRGMVAMRRPSQLPRAFRRASISASISSSVSSSPTTASDVAERRLSITKPLSAGKPVLPSIHDFTVISPISRGAFGVVHLARKKLTGEYFAIKTLKKSDMVQKNQVTNVKAERSIMISTADSPYVAKLYFTFQSRDYLYLVMEFLNGGDVASLLHSVGCLSEDWACQYAAETVMAIESVHAQGVIHRDLKPANLLIDSKGHLKLSDFGLAIRAAEPRRSRTETRLSGSGSISRDVSPFHLDKPSHSVPSTFVGTPDYVAPETINQQRPTNATDWWSLGCIIFELMYGYPPFNDETPQLVFDNILACRINWPTLEPEQDISPAAKDLILRLLTVDPDRRLSTVEQIKAHPFFAAIDWANLYNMQPSFVPETAPESVAYFDTRGAPALPEELAAAAAAAETSTPERRSSGSERRMSGPERRISNPSSASAAGSMHGAGSPGSSSGRHHFRLSVGSNGSGGGPVSGNAGGQSPTSSEVLRLSDSPVDDFGAFSYKNLPELERANKQVISKLRIEGERRSSITAGRSPLLVATSSWSDHYDSPHSSDTDDARTTHASSNSGGSGHGSGNSSGAASTSTLMQLTRVERRRRISHRNSGVRESGRLRNYAPDVLLCSSTPTITRTLDSSLTKLGCRVVICITRDEAMRRAVGLTKFDLIIVNDDFKNAVSALDFCNVVQSTSNANTNTPIVLVTDAFDAALGPFDAKLVSPPTKERLMQLLQDMCGWCPS